MGHNQWPYHRPQTGESEPLTKGELLTDGLWGLSYNLPPSAPRTLQKEYVLSRAQQNIAHLYDKQIAISESHNELEHGTGRDNVYDQYVENFDKEMLSSGLIAEQMVKSFLMKMMIDHNMPYTIEDVDVYEDVYHKIDFIIHATKKSRGVAVEESDAIGIQFTTDTREKTVAKKEKQITQAKRDLEFEPSIELDDVVLVKISLDNTRKIYDHWSNTKHKAAGGPDKLWSDDVKQKILQGVLSGLVSEDDIAHSWDEQS